jgi:hypothetical protein
MTTSPPAGAEILDLIRRPDIERSDIDHSIAPTIRRELESAADEHLPLDHPVRINKETVRRALRCEAHLVAHLGRDVEPPTAAMIRGALVDRLFAQRMVGFPIGADPVSDALAAADASDDRRLRALWDDLEPSEQEELRSSVTDMAEKLSSRWPPLPPGAYPRLQNTARIELCDGQIILSGRVDLALGRPSAEKVGTTLIDVKAGTHRLDDRDDAGWYAILETLRSGAPPFQVGNYYVPSGELDLKPVTVEDLQRATRRVADAIARVVRIAAGGTPRRSPGPLCPWCPAYEACEEGQQHIRDRDEATGEWLGDLDEDEWDDEEGPSDD